MPATQVRTRTEQVRQEAQAYRLINLSGTLRPELEERCRRNGITGYSRMNKEALKDAIIQKLFYDGDAATVTYETAEGRYECSKRTETALKAALDDLPPTDAVLIPTLFRLLDEALENGGRIPSLAQCVSQNDVITALQRAKNRYGWCGTADSCVRDMGIELGRTHSFYAGKTVEAATVKRIAEDYGSRSGFTREVRTVLQELGIDA